MKNLKKVLAMVLAFACTFSMFAGAKVFEDVPAGSDYSEAVTMLSDLGIIQGKDDGKYHPEDTITRAEACAMIARLMTGDPNVSQYVGAQSFTDVAKGSWKDSAIGYCYINGIVIGVGNNKFEPDRAITDAEFITMVVRAMGYETADMKQNYPFSYMSNAQAIGLLDGTNMVASTDALRGEDAQVIYNALFTDYARGAKLVNTTHGTSVESYPTLAESVWGLNRAAVGVWQKSSDDDKTMEMTTCKAHTWVIVDEVVDKDNTFVAVPIEDDTTDIYEDGAKNGNNLYYTFKYEGAADLDGLKGYQVELWGSGTHSEPELETVTNSNGDKVKVYSYDWDIKAVKTVKGQTAYDYNPSMADAKPDNGTIELDETSLDLDSVAANNKTLDITDEDGTKLTSDKAVEAAVNHKDGNTYKLIDWDSDGDVDFIAVDEAYYVQVESVTSKKVLVSYLKDETWEDENSNNKTVSWDLTDIVDGVEYKVPEDLKEGDILEVTSTKAYNSKEKEVVTTYTATVVEAESKELTKVSTKGGLQLSFDDEVIDLAEGDEHADLIAPENPDTYEEFEEEELGTKFDLYMNRNGFIVYSKYSEGDNGKYAMVLDTADGRNTAPRSLAQVDLLWADNSIKNGVEVASDLKIYASNGKTIVNGAYTEKQTGNKAGRFFDEQQVVGNVYKVYTDEDGVITKMVEMMTPGDGDTYTGTEYTYNSKLDRLTVNNVRNSSLEDAKAIFAVKGTDYIQWDAKTNQDNLESGLFVDPDDVMALTTEDLSDITKDTAGTAQARALDTNVRDEASADTTNATQLTGWFTTEAYSDGSNDDATQIVLSKNSNDEVSAAVMAVNTFDYFTKGNVTPALLTYVDVSGKGDERQVTVDLAMGGKFQTNVECVKGDDVDDIFDYADLSAVKDAIGNGKYVEVTTNADGKITDINFMTAQADGTMKGNFYTVTRKAVAQKSTKWFSTFADAWYKNDSEMYTLDRIEDSKSWDIIDETEFYTIDGTPSVENKSYTNHKMAVTDGFEEELANYKNGELKSTKINEEEVDYSVVVSSYVNNKHDDVDEYYVADIVTKNGKQDVEAVFAYDDTLAEVADATAVVVDTTETTLTNDAVNGLTNEVVGTWTQIGSGVKATQAEVVAVDNTNTTGVTADLNGQDIRVSATKEAGACKFVVVLKDKDGKEVGRTETITLNAAVLKTMTLSDDEIATGTFTALKAGSQQDITVQDAGTDVQVTATADKEGLDIDASTAGHVKINTKATTKAGTYTVTVKAAGYADATITVVVDPMEVTASITKSDKDQKDVEVTLTGVTLAQLKDAGVKESDFTAVESKDTGLTVQTVQTATGSAARTSSSDVVITITMTSNLADTNKLDVEFAANDSIVITGLTQVTIS